MERTRRDALATQKVASILDSGASATLGWQRWGGSGVKRKLVGIENRQGRPGGITAYRRGLEGSQE